MAIKFYTKELAAMLPSIYEAKSSYLEAFGGDLQVLQGAEAQADFLNLKISDTDVVIQEYKTGANVGFGTGTGSSNRFGPRNEVKSVDLQVKFDTPLAIHDGIDNYTVNDIPEDVVAERLALHAVAWAEHTDAVLAKELSDKASEAIEAELTEADVVEAFNMVRKNFVNAKVSKGINWLAYVSSDVYNLLVDSELAKTVKGSTVNMDEGEVYKFKGFILREQADELFVGEENAYFTVANVGQAGVGIPLSRTMDSEDFGGVVVQGAGKLGKYVPEKNKKAIVKAVFAEVAEVQAG